MPAFASLGDENLQQLAEFLDASKGERRARRRLGSPCMRVFLGITGASGAPYAARLLQALAGAGCEVGVCTSSAGIEVLATELYGDARLRATR